MRFNIKSIHAVLLSVILILLSSVLPEFFPGAAGICLAGERSKVFLGGYAERASEVTGVIRAFRLSPESMSLPQDAVAIAYHNLLWNDNGGYYYENDKEVLRENGEVRNLSKNLGYYLPGAGNKNVELYWNDNLRIVLDREANQVLKLTEDGHEQFAVEVYRINDYSLKDVTNLGAYKEHNKLKMILFDKQNLYIVDLENMRNEQVYNLNGAKVLGMNLGLPLEKSSSRLGVWLLGKTGMAIQYVSLPSGRVEFEEDISRFNFEGQLVKLVSGPSGHLSGGYGGVFLANDNGNHILYSADFQTKIDCDSLGEPLGEVKDILWTVHHGFKTRAAIVLIEKNGLYLKTRFLEADSFYSPKVTH